MGTMTLCPRAVCVHGAHHTPKTVFTLGGVEQVVAEPSRIVEVAQAPKTHRAQSVLGAQGNLAMEPMGMRGQGGQSKPTEICACVDLGLRV